MEDITKLTVHELVEKLDAKELTSEEIVSAYAKRIEDKEKDVGAFVTVTTDKALEKAKEVDKEGNKISAKNRLLRFLFIMILIIGTQLQSIFPSGRYSEQCGYMLESNKYLYLLSIQILCIIIYMSLIFSRTKQNLYDKLTKTFVTENKKRTILFALMILLIGLFLMLPLALKDLLISMEPETSCLPEYSMRKI